MKLSIKNKGLFFFIKNFIIFLAAIGGIGFFAFCAILNVSYDGIESGNSYVLYTVLIGAVASVLCIKRDVHDKLKISAKMLAALVFFFLMALIYYIGGGNVGSESFIFFRNFIVWAFPATLAGMYFTKKENRVFFWKSLDIFMLMLTIYGGRIAVNMLINGRYSVGTNYQLGSYVAAFAFGLNLYLITLADSEKRFKFANSVIFSIIQFILLPLQAFSVVIGGGRGAFVTLIAFVAYVIISSKKAKKILRMFIIIILILLTFLIVLNLVGANEVILSGWNRISALIFSNEITNANTSGRYSIYEDAFRQINKKPFLGYGFFRYRNTMFYPHNIFLEVLLQGGISFLYYFYYLWLRSLLILLEIIKLIVILVLF